MGEIVEGLGGTSRERIAELRAAGRFFWADVALADTTREQLAEVFGIAEHALVPLLDFRDEIPPSRKFHADGEHVFFSFSCFLDTGPIETHVLVSGGYVLTVHEEPVALPRVLDLQLPERRSEQYLVYAILDAMVATAFDELNAVELTVGGLQLSSTDLRASVIRMTTLRTINSQLSQLRRRVAPQRGIFERVGEEIGHVDGLEPDSERYFERIGAQLNHLVDGIDAADGAVQRLIDMRVNETIYWLTVVSTIFLPLTFVTGFFGMNFGWMVERLDTPLAFFVLGVGGCVAGVALTLLAVRRRGTPVEPDERIR